MEKTIIIILFFPTILFGQNNLKYAETIKVEDLEKHLVAPHMLKYRERVKDMVRSAELRITTSQLNS